MLQLAFELTNRCDIACLHCLRDKVDVRDDINREFVVRMLDEAKKMGVLIVSFTGGEPTLHPDYIFFIDEIAKRGMRWITVTNGHNFELFQDVFKDQARLRALDLLAISVDGANEEVHDKIRGKGSFKKIMRTASMLQRMGVKLRFQMTLTTANIHQLEDFCVLTSTMGIKQAFFGYMQATQKNVQSGLMLTPEDYRRAQIRIAQLNQVFSIEVGQTFGYYHPSPMYKCTVLNNNAMNIDYRGNMVFCCQLSNFGDVSYVYERQEIVADLNKTSLLDGYKVMLQHIADYNKEKAEKAAKGEIKGLDLFPCFYCAKHFGKMDWAKDGVVKGWESGKSLPQTLLETDPAVPPPKVSISPNF